MSQAEESHMIELATGDSINVDGMKAKHYYQLLLETNKHEPSFISYWRAYTLKNKRVNQHLKGPRSDSVFIVLHLPYYPAGANSLKC